jgi:GTPase SAR1 family protein
MEILEKDTREIDKYVKVCFVGSSTTGKTSLIKRLIGNPFLENTILTVGYDFCFYDRVVDKLQVRYQLWDSAGQ